MNDEPKKVVIFYDVILGLDPRIYTSHYFFWIPAFAGMTKRVRLDLSIY
jgi:hypothetical protein